MPAERRNAARLGRVVELLGRHAVVLQGELARPLAQALRLGVEQMHGDLTTIALEGASEAAPDHAATPGAGGQSNSAQEGQAHAKKAITVGLKVANDGQGPRPSYDEPLAGQASGDQVTLANVTHLKEQLTLDRSLRLNARGCQSAQILAHALAQGFDTLAPITWKTTIATLVRAALAAGTVLQPLASVPAGQHQQAPAQREGYRAVELPSQVYDKRRASPVRRIVVKREGQVKRAQTVRQRQMAWIDGRLKPWQERVGPPRGTKKRIQHGIKQVLQHYPAGQG
jgi:hypothetical protein